MKCFQKLKLIIVSFQTFGFKCRGSVRQFSQGNDILSTRDYHDKPPSLYEGLRARVEVKGPLTVADYMRAVLTSPGSGYYMNRDVFGSKGDFVTSPEISQLFGEMVGVWCVNELEKFNSQVQQKQIIELGPGRGTLMRDVLRVFSSLKQTEGLSLHLVEISPELSRIQADMLCLKSSIQIIEENILGKKRSKKEPRTEPSSMRDFDKGTQRRAVDFSTVTVRRAPGVDKKDGFDGRDFCYMRGITHDGLPVFWYRSLLDVPRGFSCILAHEFFDALPIHKFKRTEHGWREVLIIPDDECGEGVFKYVIARSETPASKLLIKDEDTREEAEVCLEAALIMRQVEKRLEEDGGTMLIVDYGHEGERTDTFRAFCKHEQTDPLAWPGSADLTADVDFNYLKSNLGSDILTFGPITQSDFLRNMGVETRLKVLLENTDEQHHEQLKSGCEVITDPEGMGSKFKFFALFPAAYQSILENNPAAGFEKLINNGPCTEQES